MYFVIHVALGLLIIKMLDIRAYSNGLKNQEGIWSAIVEKELSYPSDGNNFCFDIEDQSFWFRNRNWIILEAVKKYSVEGPLFDVGGGNGFVADYLSKNNFDTILVEPGIDGCSNAKKRGLKYVINAFADREHFYANKIPNIGIFDVLEHIEDADKFLNTLNNLLIKSGRLFITVPAFHSLWSSEDVHAGHYRRFTIKELERVLAGNGFEILFSTYFFSFLFLPVFILRSIPSKIGIYKHNIQTTKEQHHSNAAINKISDIFINYELNKIRRAISIKFGSSLLIIARKK
jgi:hypothetical protein